MLKEYRLRKLKIKRAVYKAKYMELDAIMSTLKEVNNYQVEQKIKLAGILAELDCLIDGIENK